MEFHSATYGVFLAVVLALFWTAAERRTARALVLLVASWLFYAGWEAWFLALILFSTLLDWHCGKRIHAARDPRARRAWLLASLAGNLGVLGYFKYTGWAADGVERLAAAVGAGELARGWAWDAAVPVGISFYTFQTLSYTIDIYRGVLTPARNLREFALFVAFFPQLVAGPIVRAVQFLPQLERRPRLSRERLHDGLWRIGTGLAKKVLLADVIGRYLVDPVYGAPDQYAPLAHLLAVYGFAFQIYGDFAGYTDIAIGSARLLGFDLPENFDAPYKSRSVREFWRRWHISLSSWVRDYVYFPLGGSRTSEPKVARNLFVTMMLLALWHGSSVLWVLYGVWNGIAVVLERWMERARGGRFATTPLRSAVAWIVAFHAYTGMMVFVRARDLDHVGALLGDFGDSLAFAWPAWAALGAAAVTHFLPERTVEATRRGVVALPSAVVGVVLGVVVGAVAIAVVGETPYIYFQF